MKQNDEKSCKSDDLPQLNSLIVFLKFSLHSIDSPCNFNCTRKTDPFSSTDLIVVALFFCFFFFCLLICLFFCLFLFFVSERYNLVAEVFKSYTFKKIKDFIFYGGLHILCKPINRTFKILIFLNYC